MSITAQDLIDSSLRLLGVLASGETPATQERSDGLVALNQMLNNWSAQLLPIYSLLDLAYSLTASTITYQIGSGAVAPGFNTTRPIALKSASIILGGKFPLDLITAEEWTGLRDYARTAKVPEKLWYNPQYPYGYINIWPAPTGTPLLEFTGYVPLTEFASLATIVALPPGYERALRAALAVDLASEYGVAVTPQLQGMADDAKTSIFGLNQAVVGSPKVIAPQPQETA